MERRWAPLKAAQFILQTPLGRKVVAAHAILEQYKRAQSEASDPAKFAAWLPMLQQYGPALVIECENAVQYSEEVVIRWLREYMFRTSQTADAQARLAASQLKAIVRRPERSTPAAGALPRVSNPGS